MLQLVTDRPRRGAWTWVAAAAVLVALPSFRLVALTRTGDSVSAVAPAAARGAGTASAPRALSNPGAASTPAAGPAVGALPVRGTVAAPAGSVHDGNGELKDFVLRLGEYRVYSHHYGDLARFDAVKGDLLWFRRHGKGYLLRDAAALKVVKELFRPEIELGERQVELFSRQSVLRSREAVLGYVQAALGRQQSELDARQAKISAEQIRRERNGLGTSHLEAERREIGRQQDELGREQGDVGQRQAELGKQQAELDRQRTELARQQMKAGRKAVAGLARFVDDAIARGLAPESKR